MVLDLNFKFGGLIMTERYEVVGLRYAKYINKAGREVSGTMLYCQYVDDRIQGVGCAEFWVPADGAQHVAIGHQITPLYNRYGRVVSVIDHG